MVDHTHSTFNIHMAVQLTFQLGGFGRRELRMVLGLSHTRDLPLASTNEYRNKYLCWHCGTKDCRIMGMGRKCGGELILSGL
jgi:hypothetical protein